MILLFSVTTRHFGSYSISDIFLLNFQKLLKVKMKKFSGTCSLSQEFAFWSHQSISSVSQAPVWLHCPVYFNPFSILKIYLR